MANIKFSSFTTETNPANVDFLVGYEGTTMKKIDPTNIGGGATSLNGLSDVLIDGTSAYFINIPSGLSGNPADNLVIGSLAGNALTTGTRHTIIGHDAGSTITTANSNTIYGYEAAKGMAAGSDRNVVIGDMACRSNAGDDNVVIGSSAGANFTSAVEDTVVIGSFAAGSAGTSASQVIAIGSKAARSNIADQTVAIGFEAAYSQTSGVTNTYVGYRSGYSNLTGGDNTYIGRHSGYSATGARNSSLGDGAFGGGAGHSGTDNVAFGYRALQQTTGVSSHNVAIGSDALRATGAKSDNVAIGYQAGTAITTSPDNVFIGYQAGVSFDNTSGDGRNVAVGSGAGNDLTTGIYNTFLGYQAGALNTNITTGNFNVMVGYQAVGSGAAASNQNSFGYSAACTANNQITLGNTSIGTIRAQVTSITAISDERDKTSIETIPYGLEFVNSLQPKKFVWDHRAETDSEGNEFFSSNKGKKDIGFIAQELQSVDDDYLNLVYDENPDKLEATYGRLIPVLVQAIKELKAEVELLKNK